MAKYRHHAAETSIRYSILPADPHGHFFRVTLHVAHPDPQGQMLALPAWVPGSYMIRDLARHLQRVTGSCQKGPVTVRKLDKHTWQAEPVSGTLTLMYDVYAWDVSVRTAYLDQERAFCNFSSLCLRVVGQEDQPCGMLLETPPWGNADWEVATTLPAAGARKRGFGWYAAPDYDALIDHPVAMGTFKWGTFKVADARHDIAIGGCSELDMPRLCQDLAPVCAAHAALFEPETGRAPFDRYLFMTHALAGEYGGLEHRHSTALLCQPEDLPSQGVPALSEGYQQFLGLASHEYLHAWLVKRIKPANFVAYDLERENYTQQLWIFEGFTSYYDDLMLTRAGVVPPAQYLEQLAKLISRVLATPGRLRQSVAEASFDAWVKYYRQDESAPNTQVSYYAKGALIALALDLSVRAQTHGQASLDDVLRLMWRRFGRDFYTRQGARGPQWCGIPEGAFPDLLHEATGVKFSRTMAGWIDGTDDPGWEGLFKPFGIAVTRAAAERTPTLGLRTAMRAGALTVTHVLHGGGAMQAGLAAGDVIVACDALRAHEAALLRLLSRKRPGDVVQMHVFRRDQLRHVEVVLQAPALTQISLVSTPRPQRLRQAWLHGTP